MAMDNIRNSLNMGTFSSEAGNVGINCLDYQGQSQSALNIHYRGRHGIWEIIFIVYFETLIMALWWIYKVEYRKGRFIQRQKE